MSTKRAKLIFIYCSCLYLLAGCSFSNSDDLHAETEMSDVENVDENSSSDAHSSQLSSASLLNKYPELAANTENTEIVCPFLRMLNKAGLFLDEESEKPAELVSVSTISEVSKEFGCSTISCGGVASAVSAGQKLSGVTDLGYVNIEQLHEAKGIAHECGFTFGRNETQVNDQVRQETLRMLKQRANNENQVTLSDLQAVKKEICNEQNDEVTLAGSVETGLIYTFLGGERRGYVDLADVDLFLHAKLPKTLGEPGLHLKE